MTGFPRKIAVFGSTGSIGLSALEVARQSGGNLRITAISAHHCLDKMLIQAQEFLPSCVVATDEAAAAQFDWSDLPRGTRLLVGQAGLEEVVQLPEVDIVLTAIVGSAGLTGTWAALNAGKTVAVANKETLVMAGPQVIRLARERGAMILPVDSEHSAVFQAI
ncbi:MAG: 1-deoxy-D-xylulose-5-phosphate reductoisomerase, partial [Planctomycetia bacterium]|nr:1-deoxy-D-xylulose-5-phosphate reductoisomerase [Planctomycetia bacterium]